MVPQISISMAQLEAALPAERERLVRLCAGLTGDSDAAEDLAQETLIEAWRNAHKLYDLSGSTQWLSAIARNVSLRWSRTRSRERAHRAEPGGEDGAATALDEVPAGFDVEVELERSELASLLDRAMALLPPATRDVLLERYIRESPISEVAGRLGLSEGAVHMRLQRGKLLLRQLLAGELKHEAAAFGLDLPHTDDWEETRIWCPLCGETRLRGRFEPGTRVLQLRCQSCLPDPNLYLATGGDSRLFDGVHGFKPALNRLAAWGHENIGEALKTGVVECPHCHKLAIVHITALKDSPMPSLRHGVESICAACGNLSYSALVGLALGRPEGLRFWRDHPHIRALPIRAIEVAGAPALVAGFESVAGAHQYSVVYHADTFAVLGLHRPTSK